MQAPAEQALARLPDGRCDEGIEVFVKASLLSQFPAQLQDSLQIDETSLTHCESHLVVQQ